ncbi:MAG: lysozyme inhibitor LprI family protein [Pseudomonadota bacterium]
MTIRIERLMALLFAAALGAGILPETASAESNAAAAVISACLKKVESEQASPQKCIGIVADACLQRASSTQDLIACYAGETEEWDSRLNRAYKFVMGRLPADAANKLREAQRSWLDTRKLTCGFYGVFYDGGTIAGPSAASCYNGETAERALYLKFFADELAKR